MALVYERHSGGPPANFAVTGVSQIAVANNFNRSYLLVQNDSDTVIYLALNAPAVAGRGIRLNANGGSYEVNYTNLFTGPVYAIHGGAGSKNVCIQEGL